MNNDGLSLSRTSRKEEVKRIGAKSRQTRNISNIKPACKVTTLPNLDDKVKNEHETITNIISNFLVNDCKVENGKDSFSYRRQIKTKRNSTIKQPFSQNKSLEWIPNQKQQDPLSQRRKTAHSNYVPMPHAQTEDTTKKTESDRKTPVNHRYVV